MFSSYDRRHIGEIVRGEGAWFTAHLIRAIAKADDEHRARIGIGFPEEVAAFEAWDRGDAAAFDYDEPVDVVGDGPTVRGIYRGPSASDPLRYSMVEVAHGHTTPIMTARLVKVQS